MNDMHIFYIRLLQTANFIYSKNDVTEIKENEVRKYQLQGDKHCLATVRRHLFSFLLIVNANKKTQFTSRNNECNQMLSLHIKKEDVV